MAIVFNAAMIATLATALITLITGTYLYSRDAGRRSRALRLLRLFLRR
jgi:hypothetical protein